MTIKIDTARSRKPKQTVTVKWNQHNLHIASKEDSNLSDIFGKLFQWINS